METVSLTCLMANQFPLQLSQKTGRGTSFSSKLKIVMIDTYALEMTGDLQAINALCSAFVNAVCGASNPFHAEKGLVLYVCWAMGFLDCKEEG